VLTDDTTEAYWGPLHRDGYHGDYESIHTRNQRAYRTGAAHGVEPETLFRFDPKDKLVCDIGAGGGWDAAACLGAGAAMVYCLEVNDHLIEMGRTSLCKLGVCPVRFRWIDVRVDDMEALPRFHIIYSRAVFMHLPLPLVESYWSWTTRHLKPDGETHFQLFQVDGHTEFHNAAVRMPDAEAERRMADCGLVITERREIRHPHMEPVWTIYECKKGAT